MRTRTGPSSTRGEDGSQAGVESFLRGNHGPCSRAAPPPERQRPGALPPQRRALQATRGGSAGQEPPRLPSRPMRPSTLDRGDPRLEGRDSAARSGGSEKEPVRVLARSPEEEGETQTLGQSVQRHPAPSGRAAGLSRSHDAGPQRLLPPHAPAALSGTRCDAAPERGAAGPESRECATSAPG